MKKLKNIALACLASFLLIPAAGIAQYQVNSLYFLDNAPMRHYLNPAYQPLSNVYVSLPVIGFTSLAGTNNSLMLSDVIYNDKFGNPIYFLNQYGSKLDFYNTLRPNTLISADMQINLLSFGWRNKNDAYWHVSLNERMDGGVTVPRDLMRFVLFGMEDDNHNIKDAASYDLQSVNANVSLYTELSVGYSKELKNNKWTLGGAFKLLMGSANVSMRNNKIQLDASSDEWVLDGSGTAHIAGPVRVNDIKGEVSAEYIEPTKETKWFNDNVDMSDALNVLKPRGAGAAIDFGATFRPTDFMEISAAVLDLGVIRWNGNTTNIDYSVDDYHFTGVELSHVDNVNSDTILGNLTDAFKNHLNADQTSKAYWNMLSPKLNVGFEIYTRNKLIGGSILSTTKLINTRLYEELTIGANFRPCNWFNLAANYSVLNGKQHSIGAAMGLRGGPFNLTVGADYVPLTYAAISTEENGTKTNNYYVPYRQKGLNVGVGLNLVFGNRQDKDKDGVKDRKDLCPDTPRGVTVDENGCPVDTDGDGVPDYLDQCPGTPAEAYGMINESGCPKDTDGDGVPDYLDKCPDTPAEAYGMIDENGCPKDTDLDGVPDYLDECPDTPREAYGYVDEKGCLKDTDMDGVPDYLDRCPDTPAEALATIDEFGCPKDTDGDGVPDYLDKCPNTKPEAVKFVDANGCDLDTDGDGVPDYLDNCPKTPGSVSNHGCPEVKKEVRNLFKKALQGIQFETGKATIKKSSNVILNQIAKVLIENKTYLVEIQGHTDNVGKPDMNQQLSEKRANAVRDYLIKAGVDENRMTAKGYGDTVPVADNKTSAGRAKNRRVEFVVSFEEVTYE